MKDWYEPNAEPNEEVDIESQLEEVIEEPELAPISTTVKSKSKK
jgi:hypothetical protein